MQEAGVCAEAAVNDCCPAGVDDIPRRTLAATIQAEARGRGEESCVGRLYLPKCSRAGRPRATRPADSELQDKDKAVPRTNDIIGSY